LIRPKLTSIGIDKSVRNAAVSPIVWTFSSMPAIAATAAFDRPTLLAVGIAICAFVYHLSYRYLARRDVRDVTAQVRVADFPPYGYERHHVARRRHRSHDRRSLSKGA
jgi:hypothetical protein